jgi:hypothetical protein
MIASIANMSMAFARAIIPRPRAPDIFVPDFGTGRDQLVEPVDKITSLGNRSGSLFRRLRLRPERSAKINLQQMTELPMGHANIDVTQNVYGKSWWEERVDAVTRAVDAVTIAAQNAEKKPKQEQPASASNERVPLWVPQQKAKIANC